MWAKVRMLIPFTGLFLFISALSISNLNIDQYGFDVAAFADKDVVRKPDKIVAVVMDLEKSDEDVEDICRIYQERKGIELEIYSPEGNYYEFLSNALAAGAKVDCFELRGNDLIGFADNGLIWDMSEDYENNKDKVRRDTRYINSVRIDNKLYGFPIGSGDGYVTYIRKDWLDEYGLSAPTDYEEFEEILIAFTQKGTDVAPFASAGLINNEGLHSQYLKPFYQNAIPDIYQNAYGQYVDGMLENSMKEALTRLADAYSQGLISFDSSNVYACRDSFCEGKVGAFCYQVGNWANKLNEKAQLEDTNAEVIPLYPFDEALNTEETPDCLAIYSGCGNPRGVYKHFVEYISDGSKGEMLFSCGIENIDYIIDNEGNLSSTKNGSGGIFKLEKSITPLAGLNNSYSLEESSRKCLKSNFTITPPDVYANRHKTLASRLDVIREGIITEVVTGELTVREGIRKYKKEGGPLAEELLSLLNG